MSVRNDAAFSRRDFCRTAAALGAAATLGARTGRAAVAPAADPKSPWKIGCFTRPWDRFEYRVALDAIAGRLFRYGVIESVPVFPFKSSCFTLRLHPY